jgi:hypothetical protein
MTDAHPRPAKTIRIGRQPDNDIALTGDLDVSRHHAELHRNPDGSFEIIDLGTHNGTYINGERITRKMLTGQDIISIGHATFRLSDGELRQYADEGPGSDEPGGPASLPRLQHEPEQPPIATTTRDQRPAGPAPSAGTARFPDPYAAMQRGPDRPARIARPVIPHRSARQAHQVGPRRSALPG